MARPWPKKSEWPYVAKSGRQLLRGRLLRPRKSASAAARSRRCATPARGWTTTSRQSGAAVTVCVGFCWTSTRRRPTRLRREASGRCSSSTSRSTLTRATRAASRPRPMSATSRRSAGICSASRARRSRDGTLPPTRYAVAVASVPAVRFNEPQAPRAWREQMLREGVPKPTRDQAWRVLSAALSWAAARRWWARSRPTACILATEPRVNRRRSLRAGGTGYDPAGRRRGLRVPSWALSPQAVEAIRAQMLLRVTRRREAILAHRDAMVVSLQYGLCARNQEVWGMRWASLDGEFAWVLEVLSCGRLDEWGKTEHSTQRRTAMPSLLREDLPSGERPCGPSATRPERSTSSSPAISPARARRPRPTHRRLPLQRKPGPRLGARFFTPAVEKVATAPELFARSSVPPPTRCAAAASPYACAPRTHKPSPASAAPAYDAQRPLRLRDRGPPPNGPRPADVEWRVARTEQIARSHEEDPSASIKAAGHGGRRRKSIFAWLSARKRAPRAS